MPQMPTSCDVLPIPQLIVINLFITSHSRRRLLISVLLLNDSKSIASTRVQPRGQPPTTDCGCN